MARKLVNLVTQGRSFFTPAAAVNYRNARLKCCVSLPTASNKEIAEKLFIAEGTARITSATSSTAGSTRSGAGRNPGKGLGLV
jgi:hypothetical protein